MSLDLSGYLDVFADEAREHLQNLNQALLEFERDAGNIDHVNVMFRSAHTLKGMSATMGFTEVAELTHNMENLLTPIREGKLAVTGEIVDLLFKCLDALQEMAEAHIASQEHSVAIDSLVNELVRLTTGKAPAVPVATATGRPVAPAGYPGEVDGALRDQLAAEANNGRTTYHLHITLDHSCELRNVRAFMVLKALKEHADILQGVPDEATLTGGEFGFEFHLLASSAEGAEVLAEAALSVLEIESAVCLHFEQDTGEPATSDAPALSSIFNINDYLTAVLGQARKDGYNVVFVNVTLHPECTLKSARAFMVNKQLEELGEIIAIKPDVEDIEFEKFDRDLYFLLLTKEPATRAQELLNQVSELSTVKVFANPPVHPGPAAAPQHSPTAPAGATPPPGARALAPAATDSPAKGEGDSGKPPAIQAKPTQTIRVDTSRLDHLLNLVGELVIGKTRLQQLAREIKRSDLSDTIEQFDLIVFDLQNVVMQTRMVPIETVFNRFPRMIRDLAKARDKQIELVMTGGETELDRTVIDEIGDPLVHLIRNALDHGIEPASERLAKGKSAEGTLTLAAFHEGSHVFIQIKDDGAGIDPERIRQSSIKKGLLTEEKARQLTDQEAIHLIFAAGLSTAEQVTDISGRGVGMDVVRSKIEYLSGEIKVDTKVGRGSTFTIKLPLTLAIVQALLVKVSDEDYAIPLAYIEETLRIRRSQIQTVNKRHVYVLRGDVLPLVWVRDLLGSPPLAQEPDSWFVVVVRAGSERIGLCVDQPGGQMEIVIKTLGKFLQNVPYIAGGTILGDGTVALILDVAQFGK
jgi:two-component system, chemotaxis family, sensor kinase CheA